MAEAVANTAIEVPSSKFQKGMRRAGWAALFTFALLLFTLMKLPETRIKNYVQGNISAALAPRGITLNAAQSSLSVGFGISYSMKDVTLSFATPQAPIHIDRIEVSPSILSMIIGKMGGRFWIYNGDGTLKGAFSMSTRSTKQDIDASFTIHEMNLGKLGVFPLAANIQGSAIANGEASVTGDLNLPGTFNGSVDLNLNKITLDQQSIQGFAVPRLSISEGKIDVAMNQGKATIKTLKLGKPGSTTDDIIANVTGDIQLGKQWESSTMNLKTRFSLSQNVLKSFVLIDALLGNGKQSDGSYAFNLTGPLDSPAAAPGTP